MWVCERKRAKESERVREKERERERERERESRVTCSRRREERGDQTGLSSIQTSPVFLRDFRLISPN